MEDEDFRVLAPLIYQRVTPHRLFDLDMDKRLMQKHKSLKWHFMAAACVLPQLDIEWI